MLNHSANIEHMKITFLTSCYFICKYVESYMRAQVQKTGGGREREAGLFEGRMREQRAERQLACCLFIWGKDAGTESRTATWLSFITSSQTPVPSKGFWPLSKLPPRRKIEFYKRENIICFSQAEKKNSLIAVKSDTYWSRSFENLYAGQLVIFSLTPPKSKRVGYFRILIKIKFAQFSGL